VGLFSHGLPGEESVVYGRRDMMNKEQIKSAVLEALEEKGKRKFTQTVDLGINFQNVDFSKQENRLNLEVLLPKGTGKAVKIAVFADGQTALDAKNAKADLVLPGDDIPKLKGDQAKLKSLLEYEFLAETKLMAVVGKHLGQFLGTRGKLPKPLMGGSVADIIERARRTVRVKSKGKFLPVVHVRVGTESMPPEDIIENVETVFEKVKGKVGEHGIKSVYVKLTMGKPVFLGAKPKKAEVAG
jgi:large subunit ribosomal protein L1